MPVLPDPVLYFAGRTLQVIGLLLLPSAIWAAEVLRSEAMAIGIFLGSVVLFFAGWIFLKIR